MNIITFAPLVFSGLIPVVLYLYSTFIRIPGWHFKLSEETEEKWTWSKLNTVSLISSIGASAFTWIMTYIANAEVTSAIALVTAVAVMTYVFVQSFITDRKLRFADRGTLQLAILLSLAVNIAYYFNNSDVIHHYDRNAWIIAVICAYLLMYTVKGFGASDGRAVTLCVAAAVPVVGIVGVLFSFSLYALLAISFVIFIVMKYKVSSIAYVNHISIPAVPILVFPFLFISVYASIDIAFALGWAETIFGWFIPW